MNHFEEHARRAADHASESVDGLDVPELHGGPSAGARLALAAAAVVVIVLAGFALVRGDDPDTVDVSTDESDPADDNETDQAQPAIGPDEIVYLTFGDAPFDQVVANEGTSEGAEFSVSLYGAGTDEDPIVDGFVVAAGLAAGSDERLDEGETFTVRGTEAVRVDDDLSGAETIEWFEPSGVVVQLGSDVLDLDELIALAETLIIEGTEISLPNPPADMQVLIDRAPSTDLPLPNSGWSLYAFDDGADQSRSLTGSRSVENGIHLLRAVFEADEAVDVRGTTGWTTGDETFPVVLWEEAGTVFTLGDDTGADPLAIAEQLVRISREEFTELMAASADPAEVFPADDGPGTVKDSLETIAQGTIDRDGETLAWTHYVSSDGDRCFDLEDAEGVSGQCAGDASVPASARFRLLSWWPYSLDGMVSDEVASIVLFTDSNIGGIPLTSLAGGGQAFLRFLDQDERPWLLEAYDATNEPLWQVVLPDEPRWTYDRGGDTRFGSIASVLDVSYEVIDGGLVEQRLFVTDLGTVCHEYVRDDVQSDCPGSDSPFAIGGVQGDTMELAPIRIEGVTSASGRVSNEVDRVEVITDRRVYQPLLHELEDGSAFATMLEVGEDLISVSAYGDDGEQLARWETAPPPSYPTSGGPDTTYPTAGD